MEIESRHMVRILMDEHEAGVLFNALDTYKDQLEEDPNGSLNPEERGMIIKFVDMLEDFV